MQSLRTKIALSFGLFATGCVTATPLTEVSSSRCVLSCVHYEIQDLDQVDGSAVESLEALCLDALDGRRCCLAGHSRTRVAPCDTID